MNRYFLLLIIAAIAACMPEEDLPLKGNGNIPDYFIECYCKPGESLALSLSHVIPIGETIRFEYPEEMSVFIHDGAKIQLLPAFLPNNDFMCNYYSNHIFSGSENDTLFLEITGDKQKKITAWTEVPERIKISSCEIGHDEVSVRFYTSEKPSQNYYIYTVEQICGDTVRQRTVAYLDLSGSGKGNLTEKTVVSSQVETAEKVILSLKRVTEPNYRYQLSVNGANNSYQSSITNPISLEGNLSGSLGIFTCYTEDSQTITLSEQKRFF